MGSQIKNAVAASASTGNGKTKRVPLRRCYSSGIVSESGALSDALSKAPWLQILHCARFSSAAGQGELPQSGKRRPPWGYAARGKSLRSNVFLHKAQAAFSTPPVSPQRAMVISRTGASIMPSVIASAQICRLSAVRLIC